MHTLQVKKTSLVVKRESSGDRIQILGWPLIQLCELEQITFSCWVGSSHICQMGTLVVMKLFGVVLVCWWCLEPSGTPRKNS